MLPGSLQMLYKLINAHIKKGKKDKKKKYGNIYNDNPQKTNSL